MIKSALVLGGGGSRGAYEIGVIKALNEMNAKFDIVTGTSVGALNSCLLSVNGFSNLEKVWKEITFENVINHKFTYKNKSLEIIAKVFFKRGFSIEPLVELMKKYIVEEDVRNSKIKFGLVYTEQFGKYRSKTIDEIPNGSLIDYISTSCSAIPFFRRKIINGKKCYDGYYSDNLPIKLAIEMGAESIIAVDIMKGFRKKVKNKDIEIFYLKPSKKLNFFLNFDNTNINSLIEIGYNDTIKNAELTKFLSTKNE